MICTIYSLASKKLTVIDIIFNTPETPKKHSLTHQLSELLFGEWFQIFFDPRGLSKYS